MDEETIIRNSKWQLIIFIILTLIDVFLYFNISIERPEKVIKSFVVECNSIKVEKLYKKVDWVGVFILYKHYNYENYKEFLDIYDKVKNSDEYKEFKENLDYKFDDVIDDIEDYLEKCKITIKEIKKTEKVAKNLYVVEAIIQGESNGKKNTITDELYIIKKGFKYYLIDGELVETVLFDYLFPI